MKKLVLPIALLITCQPACAWFEIRESNSRRPLPPPQITQPVATVIAGAHEPPGPGAVLPADNMAKATKPVGTSGGVPFPLPASTPAAPPTANTPSPPAEPDRSWMAQPGPLRAVFEQITTRHGFTLEWRQGKKSEIWETSHPLPLKGKDIKSDANDAGSAINYRQRVIDVTVHEGNKVVEVSVIE